MCVLEHSLSDLVTNGIISIDEARAVSLYPDEIRTGSVGIAPTATTA